MKVPGGLWTEVTSLVNILADNIVSNGGTIIRNQKVEKLVMDKGRAEYITLSDGERIRGRHFIANIHPGQILDMVEPGTFRKIFRNRIMELEDTMGMFTLYLVFKKNTVAYSNHNFYHFNQDNAWVASDYQVARWPQNYLYMHTASSGSDGYAASGSVITYMNYAEVRKWEHTFTGDRGEDYEEFKRQEGGNFTECCSKAISRNQESDFGVLYLNSAYLARLYRYQGRIGLWRSQGFQ